MNKKILFIGAGSMSEAMISGIVSANIIEKQHIFVTNKQDRARLAYIEEKYGVKTSYNMEELMNEADVIILAMKPKDVKESLISIRPLVKESHLFISVLAGVTTETMEEMLQKDVPVIRAMPNTSASIGLSATAIALGKHVQEENVSVAEELLQTIGIAKVVKEELMDTVTAVSGSGPAFIYYFVEAMMKAALEAGMDGETAEELIAQTVIGAGKMLKESGESPETLRKNITSPGGTTEAGVKSLKDDHFEKIIISCIHQAKNRSAELSRMTKML